MSRRQDDINACLTFLWTLRTADGISSTTTKSYLFSPSAGFYIHEPRIIEMAHVDPNRPTSLWCTVDFSLIPVTTSPTPSNMRSSEPTKFTDSRFSCQIGSQEASFSKQIAEIYRLLQQSGLNFRMHSTGTTVGQSPN